jgi:putative membrane protein
MSKRLLLSLLVTVVGPFAFSACATNEQRAAPQEPVEPPESASAGPEMSASQMSIAMDRLPEPDRSFLRQALGANLAAVRFGQLAANNGASVEIRSLGREMVDTHTALSDQLRASAATENITLPMPQMTPRQEQLYMHLSRLTGPAFDQAFERAVIEQQNETITSFENEAANGRLSELAMLANQTLPILNQRVHTVRNQLQRM